MRQGCPLSPTLFGIFFDDLHARLLADCPTAGLDCQGLSVPALFYADDVVLPSDTASGLQQLLDSMQGFCLASGLTISIPKTEVVVFGGGHHACAWAVAGQQLQRSQSFTYLGMLFHEDRHIKHAVQHRHAKALASLAPSSRAIVTSNVPTPCSYSSVFSKLFCSRLRPMHARSGRQQQQLQVP